MASTKRARARKRKWRKKALPDPLLVGDRVVTRHAVGAADGLHGVIVERGRVVLGNGELVMRYMVRIDSFQNLFAWVRSELVREEPVPVDDQRALVEWLSA